MDQDEKTARGHRGVPVVRATPPVGTPLGPHHAPPSASAMPAKTASQPRTLGGLTARLVTPEPEEDALSIDPLGSSSLPYDPRPWEAPDSVALLGEPAGAPLSQTVGGTARLQAVSEEEAAAAKRELDLEEKAKAAAPPPVAPPVEAPQPAAPPAGAAPADDDGSSTAALLDAPRSVGVGLIFFAMGSMFALTVDGRVNMYRPQVASTLAMPPSVPSTPPPPTAPSAAVTAPSSRPTASVTGASLPLPLSAAPSGKPSVTGVPSVGVRTGGGTKKPPLPFP